MLPKMSQVGPNRFSLPVYQLFRQFELMKRRIPKFLYSLQFQDSFSRSGKRRRNDQAPHEIGSQARYCLSGVTSDVIAAKNRPSDPEFLHQSDDCSRLALLRVDLLGICLMLIRGAKTS